MPELPEVETVRRVLEPHLLKKTITEVKIHNAQVIAAPLPEQFAEGMTGQSVAAFTRRGKFLRLLFDSGDYLTVHLRMTGCLTVEPKTIPAEKHTHVRFSLGDGNELRYEDVRRFGKLWFTRRSEEDISGAKELGIEPFDSALNAAYLREKCQNSKKPVKSMLLDQSIVAGIGNIYSDEILFAAGIRPDRACSELTDGDFERLAAAIPERLAFFIEKNAISFEEYALSKGKDYRNTPFLRVYGKSGEPCPACGSTLLRTVIGGRSAVYCPHCQN